MSTPPVSLVPPVRPEYERPPEPLGTLEVETPLPLRKRLVNQSWLRKTLIAIVLIAIWEVAARMVANDLLLPTFTDTFVAFVQGIWSGELIAKTAISMSVLIRGYLLGVALAFGLTVLTMAYAVGGISGGHFNPAVSLGLAIAGRFEWRELIPYWIIQVIAGVAAAAVLYVIASGAPNFAAGGFASNGYADHSPAPQTGRRPARPALPVPRL